MTLDWESTAVNSKYMDPKIINNTIFNIISNTYSVHIYNIYSALH